jgi:hypothetical protein
MHTRIVSMLPSLFATVFRDDTCTFSPTHEAPYEPSDNSIPERHQPRISRASAAHQPRISRASAAHQPRISRVNVFEH